MELEAERPICEKLMTSPEEERYGAAVHEAGHVVVARALGLKTRRMAIAINGDNAAGAAEIETGAHLPLVDQIAICSAGADAQRILDAPTHDVAALSDMVKIHNLVDDHAEEEGEALRHAGYLRSTELLRMHRAAVERLAQALVSSTELDEMTIEQLLAQDPTG
jgi:ATP-dependent Zn protease